MAYIPILLLHVSPAGLLTYVKQHAVGFLPDLFRLIQGVSNAPESTLIQTGASPHRKTPSKGQS